MNLKTVDFKIGQYVKVEGYEGISFVIHDFYSEEFSWTEDLLDHSTGKMVPITFKDERYDYDTAICVMVGDDREFILDVGRLTQIDEDDFCQSCGQIGCGH